MAIAAGNPILKKIYETNAVNDLCWVLRRTEATIVPELATTISGRKERSHTKLMALFVASGAHRLSPVSFG